MPSLQPEGIGFENVPPVGFEVIGELSLDLLKTIDLYTPCPGLPSPFILVTDQCPLTPLDI